MKDKLRELAETLRLGDCNDAECQAMANLITQLLDAEGDGGAVGTVIADLSMNFAWVPKDVPVGTKLYTHPARSGVVSDEDVRDAARWRFFCDNIGSEYGDGYSEPRENSACLEWQQGPWIRDGSNGGQGRADTFPGWSAIIDKMMEDEQRALEELDDPTDAAIQGERHER